MTKFVLKGFDYYGDPNFEYPEYIKEFDTFEDLVDFIDNDEDGTPSLTYFVYFRDESGKDNIISWDDYFRRRKLLPGKDLDLPF